MNQKIDEQGHRPPGAAFLSAAQPGRSGHVQVGPAQILGELAEEEAAVQAPPIGSCRIWWEDVAGTAAGVEGSGWGA